MHKYKVTSIPVAQKAMIYSEGKQAFAKGEHPEAVELRLPAPGAILVRARRRPAQHQRPMIDRLGQGNGTGDA